MYLVFIDQPKTKSEFDKNRKLIINLIFKNFI